jgi:hypothetical protein
MPYRGFSDDDIINLVVTGQAKALGHGEGTRGALKWIDNCGRAIGPIPDENFISRLIENLKPQLVYRLEENTAHRARIAYESQYW